MVTEGKPSRSKADAARFNPSVELPEEGGERRGMKHFCCKHSGLQLTVRRFRASLQGVPSVSAADSSNMSALSNGC